MKQLWLVAAVLVASWGVSPAAPGMREQGDGLGRDAAAESPDARGGTPGAGTPGGEGLPLDQVVRSSVTDIEAFWDHELPRWFGLDFEPVGAVVGYRPSNGTGLPACGGIVGPVEAYLGNAFYCFPEDVIIYDAENLMPDTYSRSGELGVGAVLAHEYAHAVQERVGAGSVPPRPEPQADCLAGAWVRAGAYSGGSGQPELADLYRVVGVFAEPEAVGRPDPSAPDPSAPDRRVSAGRVASFVRGLEMGIGGCVMVPEPEGGYPVGTWPVERR